MSRSSLMSTSKAADPNIHPRASSIPRVFQEAYPPCIYPKKMFTPQMLALGVLRSGKTRLTTLIKAVTQE